MLLFFGVARCLCHRHRQATNIFQDNLNGISHAYLCFRPLSLHPQVGHRLHDGCNKVKCSNRLVVKWWILWAYYYHCLCGTIVKIHRDFRSVFKSIRHSFTLRVYANQKYQHFTQINFIFACYHFHTWVVCLKTEIEPLIKCQIS